MISIPNGPSELAIQEAAWGLARYAAISQVWYWAYRLTLYYLKSFDLM